MKQTVDFGYGKATFANTSASYAFMKIDAPFTRVSGSTSGQKVPSSEQSAPVGNFDGNGFILTGKVAHDQGTVLLLQVSWKRRGIALRDGVVIVRLREGAPLYNVYAHLPTDAENRYGDSIQMFSGNADLVTRKDLAMYDIEVPRNWAEKFMGADEVAECFRIVKVRDGLVPRPNVVAVVTPEGSKLREIAAVPERRLRLRRGQ